MSKESTVPSLVLSNLGIRVEPTEARFSEDGWNWLGRFNENTCSACTTPLFAMFKWRVRPDNKTGYNIWAVICANCREIRWSQHFGKRALEELAELAAPHQPDDWASAPTPSDPETASSPSDSSAAPPQTPSVPNPAAVLTPPPNPAQLPVPPPGDQESIPLQAARLELTAIDTTTRTLDVGVARPQPETPTSTFIISNPAVDLSTHPTGELFLAQEWNSDTSISCEVRYASEDEVMVSTSTEVAESEELRLFIRTDPTGIARAYVKKLEDLKGQFGFGSALLGLRSLERGRALSSATLNDEQCQAAGALAADGLACIWGPPGTGKTRVIGEAVKHLISLGKTVCVVSNTNIAVDQALLHVAHASGDFQPGHIIRIGNPADQRVQEHPHLTLEKALAVKFEASRAELLAHQSSLTELREQLEETEELLATVGDRGPRRIAQVASQGAKLERRAKAEELLDATESDAAQARLLRAEIERLAHVPALTADEEKIVRWVKEAGGVPGGVSRFVRRVDQAREQAKRCEKQVRVTLNSIERLQKQLEAAEADILRSAHVVGTTLAQLVLRKTLTTKLFDHVIVDEASAALPHTVLTALSHATAGGAIVGDFQQNGPISACQIDRTPTELAPWLFDNSFSLLGINSATSAQNTPGCVTLRHQYRFGPTVTELINASSYDGALTCGRTNKSPRSEITIVDTSNLGATGLVNRGPSGSGRWWAAGAALCTELIKLENVPPVGIITPYRHQELLIRSRLADRGFEVNNIGTVHRFQGREYATVIVDLVEGGDGYSWIARADALGNAWQRTGQRLFTVAMTRATEHTFMISDLASIENAKTGPLRDVRRLLNQGLINVVDARSLIPEIGPPPQAPVPFDTELELGESRLLDQNAFYERLNADLAEAQRRCVVFSPFASIRRLEMLQSSILRAADRGIQITIYTKPEYQTNYAYPTNLVRLDEHERIDVRTLPDMHEKVVLIDDAIAYVGSLNVLSSTGATSEVMIRLIGERTCATVGNWMRQRVRFRKG